MSLLKAKINTLPTNPGVYLFRDAKGAILYIGKAKNLNNRVRTYFANAVDLTRSKQVMVHAAADVETIITNTEAEALILESTLIKRHRPEYNIDLKDDKYFLYIKITADEYPTLETVRRIGTDRSKYFGPYASARAVRTTLKMLKNIFHYRTCKPGQGRPCFDYTIGRCAGPCVNAIGPRQYQAIIKNITSFLRGNMQPVIDDLNDTMRRAAKQKQYEKAAQYRDQLEAVSRLRAAQQVVAPRQSSQDVIGLVRRDGLAAVNRFVIRGGALIDKQNFLIERTRDLPDQSVLNEFLLRYYPQTTDWPQEIIVRLMPPDAAALKQLTGARNTVPQKGKKRQLLTMSETNAADWLKRSQEAEGKRKQLAWQALAELGRALRLAPPPRRIEVYDISNLQGVNAVGSMITFINGLPENNQYRKFNIRTVRGANDPAMLAEVVRRRFTSDQLKNLPWPDLIILDGGRGQLSVVDKQLPTRARPIPVVALAKRLEEIYTRDQSTPQRLPENSPAYFLLQRLRDEAHRFAIGAHRRRHEVSAIHSKLDDVPGIGPVTKKRLLQRFGSVEGILKANPSELTGVVNEQVVRNLYDHLG